MHWTEISVNHITGTYLNHRAWKKALALTSANLAFSKPGEVVSVIGPTRAGKTSMINQVVNEIPGARDYKETGYMPAVYLMAENSSQKAMFSTKAFAQASLDALKHPFYGISEDETDDFSSKTIALLGKTPETSLRQALVKALKVRKVKYLIIDEAQHVLYAQGGAATAEAILNSWKCLAQLAGVVVVLVGTYSLADAIGQCAHMVARDRRVHFERYRLSQADMEDFLGIVNVYNDYIPTPEGTKGLEAHANLLYEGSFGCIGLLEAWLRTALAMAKVEDDAVLTKQHLMDTMTSIQDRERVAAEISYGESMLDTSPPDKGPGGGGKVSKPQKKKSKTRPFQKKPRRYPIDGR